MIHQFSPRLSPRLIVPLENNVIPLNYKKSKEYKKRETYERLIAMTNETNLVALDKTLAAIRRSHKSPCAAAARVGSIGERMIRAVYQLGLCVNP